MKDADFDRAHDKVFNPLSPIQNYQAAATLLKGGTK
jgi:hypothetical protein